MWSWFAKKSGKISLFSALTATICGAVALFVPIGSIPAFVVIVTAGCTSSVISAASGINYFTNTNSSNSSESIELNKVIRKELKDKHEMLLSKAEDIQFNTPNSTNSFNLYLKAARSGSVEALAPLERMAENMEPEQQVKLSKVYSTTFHNTERAKYWREQSEEVSQSTFIMN